ncbi:MAG TPA: hypothetical protein VER14_03950, partial [Phototrophicaceae bacterium]|nr:hypothetical protein [Phototrophicaceae bacterium]
MAKLEEEGGYSNESYRSDKYVQVGGCCDTNQKNNVYSYSTPGHRSSNDIRPVLTLIYYLLDGDQF